MCTRVYKLASKKNTEFNRECHQIFNSRNKRYTNTFVFIVALSLHDPFNNRMDNVLNVYRVAVSNGYAVVFLVLVVCLSFLFCVKIKYSTSAMRVAKQGKRSLVLSVIIAHSELCIW